VPRTWALAHAEQRRVEAHFQLTYLARAAVSPHYATQLRATHDDLHTYLATQLRRAQHRGMMPVRADPAREARTLLAVLDGLATHVLDGLRTAQDAQQALDDHLDTLFNN
jgi:transcriptional regulator BetI-like protein